MEPCEKCGSATEADADGFIKFRRPVGIPDEAMPAIVAAINFDLMQTAALYREREVAVA